MELVCREGRMRESKKGMMGPGIYCTTDLAKANRFGNKFVIIQFAPSPQTRHIRNRLCRGIVVNEYADGEGRWRRRFNGCMCQLAEL